MKTQRPPHFLDVVRMAVKQLPGTPKTREFEMKPADGQERPYCRFVYTSEEDTAPTKQLTQEQERIDRIDRQKAKLIGMDNLWDLERDVIKACVQLSADGIALYLPPIEQLNAHFFEQLSAALKSNQQLRGAKFWLLENWEKMGFPAMTWEERYAKLPWHLKSQFLSGQILGEKPKNKWTFSAFKKCAGGMNLRSDRPNGPRPTS